MARTVDEWVAKHDDEAIPPRVRARVFERFDGVCQITGIKIQPGDQWQCDHIIALINGGGHRESNLQPVLWAGGHVVKTAEDMRTKSKIARVRNRHLGISGKKAVIPGSKASGWKKPLHGPAVRRNPGKD